MATHEGGIMSITSYKTNDLHQALTRDGIDVTWDEANTLRRAELTLQRWAEQECGDSNDWRSYAIERDEDTGIPYNVSHVHATGKTSRYRIPDREAGALRRVAAICKRVGAHFYRQTDPRGCALYVSTEPLTGSAYTNGIACSRR